MQQGKLTIANSSWSLAKMGKGKSLLFVFHDFDQDAIHFSALEQRLGHQYTIIAIDLPGFGKSEWVQKKLDKKTVIILVERLKLEFKTEKINIAGIGIGSLYVMMLLEQRSEWIDKALIINPMGLKRNSWETALIFNFFGKRKIKKAILHPEQTEKFLKTLINWGFIRREDLQDINRYVTDEKYRNLLNKVFVQHYTLVPETQKVKWNIKKANLSLTLYCDKAKPFQIKDAQALAKKSEKVMIEKYDKQKISDKEWLLSTIEQYFNPFQ